MIYKETNVANILQKIKKMIPFYVLISIYNDRQ